MARRSGGRIGFVFLLVPGRGGRGRRGGSGRLALATARSRRLQGQGGRPHGQPGARSGPQRSTDRGHRGYGRGCPRAQSRSRWRRRTRRARSATWTTATVDSLGLFQQRSSQGWGTPAENPGPVLLDQQVLRGARADQRLRDDADHRGSPERSSGPPIPRPTNHTHRTPAHWPRH